MPPRKLVPRLAMFEAPALAAALDAPASEALEVPASAALRDAMPASLRGAPFLSLEPWQWVGLLGLLLIGLLASLAIRSMLSKGLKQWMRHDGEVPGADDVRHAAQPFGLAAAALLWHGGLPFTGLEGVALDVLQGAVRLFGVVMGGWAGFRIADFISAGLARRAARTESRLDDLLVPLVRKTMKGGAIVLALLYALQVMGLAIGPLLASVGIGGLAVAFAAKDTIENFFGSLAVILDRPFEVGDTISVAGVQGVVQEVGFRSTRLRTPNGSLVTLPNATLVRAIVERLAPRLERVLSFTVRLDPATSARDVVATCEGIRELVHAHPRVVRGDGPREAQVRLRELGADSLDVVVSACLDVETGAAEHEAREEILLDVLRVIERLGVRLAAAPR